LPSTVEKECKGGIYFHHLNIAGDFTVYPTCALTVYFDGNVNMKMTITKLRTAPPGLEVMNKFLSIIDKPLRNHTIEIATIADGTFRLKISNPHEDRPEWFLDHIQHFMTRFMFAAWDSNAALANILRKAVRMYPADKISQAGPSIVIDMVNNGAAACNSPRAEEGQAGGSEQVVDPGAVETEDDEEQFVDNDAISTEEEADGDQQRPKQSAPKKRYRPQTTKLSYTEQYQDITDEKECMDVFKQALRKIKDGVREDLAKDWHMFNIRGFLICMDRIWETKYGSKVLGTRPVLTNHTYLVTMLSGLSTMEQVVGALFDDKRRYRMHHGYPGKAVESLVFEIANREANRLDLVAMSRSVLEEVKAELDKLPEIVKQNTAGWKFADNDRVETTVTVHQGSSGIQMDIQMGDELTEPYSSEELFHKDKQSHSHLTARDNTLQFVLHGMKMWTFTFQLPDVKTFECQVYPAMSEEKRKTLRTNLTARLSKDLQAKTDAMQLDMVSSQFTTGFKVRKISTSSKVYFGTKEVLSIIGSIIAAVFEHPHITKVEGPGIFDASSGADAGSGAAGASGGVPGP